MIPVLKINGINAIVTFLFVVALFGSLHILAAAYPTNRGAQSWIALGF